MIKLGDTSVEFRTLLARRSEPFFLSYKKIKCFTKVRNKIAEFLTKEDNKTLDKEVWTLITATTQTIRYDSDSCQISLDWTKYALANSITKKKISSKRMSTLILLLEGKGLVTLYKGFHYEFSNKKGVEKSMQSTLVFGAVWLDMFDIKLCKSHGNARIFDLVILKDCKGNIIPHKGKRGVGVEKTLLKQWNTKINDTVIAIDGQVIKPLYTTVFNNSSLYSGGRLYAGHLSSERSYLRCTITMNGEICSEVDYENNHFRILYNEKGVDFKGDCYSIHNEVGWDVKELRSACKKAGVIMLNAKSKKSAQSALIQELGDMIHYDNNGKLCTKTSKDYSYSEKVFKTIPNRKVSTDYIFAELESKHEIISDSFYKAEWGRLQNIDSLMAKQVVKAFLIQDECCLTFHDSFVCPARLQGFLIDMMREAWEIVMGDLKGFGYDIEF